MMAPRCCSLRSAVTGFTRAARVAGINIATDATTSTSPAMIPRRFPNGAAAQPRRRTSTGPFMFGSTARGEDICVTAWAVTIRIAGVTRSGDTPG